MRRLKRKFTSCMALLMCFMTIIQPLTIYAEEETAGSENEVVENVAEDGGAEGSQLTVKVNVTGAGYVNIQDSKGDSHSIQCPGEEMLEVQMGDTLHIELVPEEGQEANFYQILTKSGTEIETVADIGVLADSFMRDVDVQENLTLNVGFQQQAENGGPLDELNQPGDEEKQGEKSEVQEDGINKGLLCEDPECLTKHVGKTLNPIEITGILEGQRRNARMLSPVVRISEPYVGMTTSGKNADILFIGDDPNVPGLFAVTMNDGDYLAGMYVEGFECLNHGAANPGTDGVVQGTYEATVMKVDRDSGIITWSVVVTPPDVCEEGSIFGYQRVGGMTTTTWTFDNYGSIELHKSSSNPQMTDNNDCYSLAGAEYGVYKKGSEDKPVVTLVTDSKGYAKAEHLSEGNYVLKEIKAPKGFALDVQVYDIKVEADKVATVRVKDIPQSDPVRVLLSKIDRESNTNTPQGNASLEGAEFTIKYFDRFYNVDPESQGQTAVRSWVLKTRSDGRTALLDSLKVSGDDFYYMSTGDPTIPAGTITLQETKAPRGYLINPEIFVRQITSEGTAEAVHTYNAPTVPETVQKIKISLKKKDSETNENQAQGAGSLAGAVYEIRNDEDQAIGTITTDEQGEAAFAQDLPIDNYTMREITPPEGYLLDPKVYTIKGEAEDTETPVFLHEVKSSEQVIRGNVEIIKLAENQDEDNDTLTGLKGVEFTFTSKTTGKEVMKIVTDEKGYATTASDEYPKGSLVYDTYVVTESKCPEGFKPIEQFEVTISEDGTTLKGIYKEDKLIVSPVTVVKKDKSTGNVIPVKNTEFRLLDSGKNPVTMTTYYPDKEVHETFKTDENGQFTFPDKLRYGFYYLEEVNAPKGYLKGELLKFEVKYGATWDNPLVIEYFDENAMGKIQIQKTDEETGKALEGAVFDITAAEDIITPDGTLRLKKGDLADTVTTGDDGKAVSKELYLGKYDAKEKQQPDGFVREEKVYRVELRYKDQVTSLVQENLMVSNLPTYVKLIKRDSETKEGLSGVTFAVWNQAMLEEPDAGMALKESYTTDKDGLIELKYLAPGTYCFQEIESAPDYMLDDTVYEITISEDGRIDGQDMGTLEVENIKTELIGTTAKDKDTGNQEAVPKKDTTFTDTVEFKNLQIGREYTVKGTLMNKSTGKPLLVDGKEVHGETVFVPKTKDGKVDVVFSFDASALKGQTIVVFEKVFVNDIEILAHEDINDEGQTVEFPNSQIRTTAKDQDTECNEAVPKKDTTIMDTVEYKDLIVGREYTIRGTLMDKATNKALLIDGMTVTAEKTFIPEKKDGSIDLMFTFDASALKGQTIVVFEKLFADETEVAVHEDITDKDQTIEFPDSQIHTTAKDKDSGTQEMTAKKDVTIIDTVTYENLISGRKYTVKGILMDKSTKKPLLIDGKTVTAEKDFIPEKRNGSIDVEFKFDASNLKNQEIVVFEKLYTDGIEVASHEDINDQGQTVKIKIGTLSVKMPGKGTNGSIKTGDFVKLPYIFVILLGCSIVLITGTIVYKKRGTKKNEEE